MLLRKFILLHVFNKCNEPRGSHSSKFSSMVQVLFSRQRALQRKLRSTEAIEFREVQPARLIYNFTKFDPFIINIKNLKKLRQED